MKGGRKLAGASEIEDALRKTGELLAARGEEYWIVAIGGAVMNLLGLVARATIDVDVVAMADPKSGGALHLRPPDHPLPAGLARAARTVAGDLGFAEDWLNAGPRSQWQTGFPPDWAAGIEWRQYGGLHVGLVDRRVLIHLKLHAAADDVGPRSVHFQDLMTLTPTEDELERAAEWIRSTQDPSPGMADSLSKLLTHVRTL